MEKLYKEEFHTLVLFYKHFYCDQIKEDKIGGICSTNGED
jgi:hypothetical protein